MRIIISPAKKMEKDNDVFKHRQMPVLIEKSETLLKYLKTLSYKELKSIWKCSDNLAKINFDRIKDMDLYSNLTPAILSYQGLQYQYISPGIFINKELDYIEKYLRILSGFYGILRPFDGITPYRLEMKAKLIDWNHKSLYNFWNDKIAKVIFSESQYVINLASKEYTKSISKYLTEKIQLINCIFGELIDGKVVEKATLVKIARGEMIRFMAENNIEEKGGIKNFNRLDYVYKEKLSDVNNYVFIKKES